MRTLCTAALLAATAALCQPSPAAAEAEQPAVLPAGEVRAQAAAGPLVIDREWTWGLALTLSAGITERVELALPLALNVQLIGDEQGSGLTIAAGVVDLWITEGRAVLVKPSLIFAGRARVASEASFRCALEFSGVETWTFAGDHPAWVRGAVALVIDMGPWLTVAGGLSHQRQVLGEDPPIGAHRTGWVGDSRFSAGAVRAEPFRELPTFAIHAASWLDVVALVRVDIDSDRGSTDLRLLAGFELGI
ncbi:MAG: hypothetical protein JRF63_11805 [Deltaproteobacteria bacterium]|nr:hypothetical protein [Deltaproteobacteria bacterium]